MNKRKTKLRIPATGIDIKIVTAFERLSQVIRTLAWKTAGMLQLNPVQAQVLVFLLYHDKEPGSISNLAKEFNVTKASISDTVSSLERKKLIRKICSGEDARHINIKLTDNGRQAAKKVASYANDLVSSLSRLSSTDKQKLFSILGDIIFDLHSGGLIPVQRMCRTCDHYGRRGKAHYCKLLERSLVAEQLQLDCPDHRSKVDPSLS